MAEFDMKNENLKMGMIWAHDLGIMGMGISLSDYLSHTVIILALYQSCN